MKKYTIFKGCHYSNFIPNFHHIKNNYYVFKSTFIFDETCKYYIDEDSCVNKLFGFCFGFGVHKNSIRFGWTYNEVMNNIYIWSYFYKNGKLHKNKIYSCNLNEQHTYKIELFGCGWGKYYFHLFIDGNDVTVLTEDHLIQSKCKFITTLGPYFGGKTTAPHTIKIFKQ